MQVIIYGANNPTSKEIARQIGNAQAPIFRDRLQSIDSHWHSQIACISMATGSDLIKLAKRATRNYVTVISEELQSLKDIAAEFDDSCCRPIWQNMAHIVVAGLLIDVGIRDELLRKGLIRRQPSDFWIWAFENGTCARSAFGLKVWRSDKNTSALHELWSHFSQRPVSLKITASDISVLQSISLGNVIGATAVFNEEERQSILKLLFYKFLRQEEDHYKTNLPVLHASNEQAVKAEIARVAQRIVSGSVQEAMAGAVQIYQSETETDVPDLFRHAFARLLLEHAMDAVLDAHLLAEFPRKAEYPWGCWLTSGIDRPR